MIPTSSNLKKIDAERHHIKLGGKSYIKLDLRSIFDIYNAGDKSIVINWDNFDWDVIFAKKDAFYDTCESVCFVFSRCYCISLQYDIRLRIDMMQVDLVEATSEPTFSEYSIMIQNDQG